MFVVQIKQPWPWRSACSMPQAGEWEEMMMSETHTPYTLFAAYAAIIEWILRQPSGRKTTHLCHDEFHFLLHKKESLLKLRSSVPHICFLVAAVQHSWSPGSSKPCLGFDLWSLKRARSGGDGLSDLQQQHESMGKAACWQMRTNSLA